MYLTGFQCWRAELCIPVASLQLLLSGAGYQTLENQILKLYYALFNVR